MIIDEATPIVEIYAVDNGWIIVSEDSVKITEDTCSMHEIITNILKGK